MKLLVKNIKKLVLGEELPKTWVEGADMKVLPSIDNAYLYIYDGLFATSTLGFFQSSVALASSLNPGSSPSGEMKFVLSLDCVKMRRVQVCL